MALKALSNNEHSRLLLKIDHLPYERSASLRNELTKAYQRYNQQLIDLSETISTYEAIAAKVRTRQTLKKVVEEDALQLIEQ